MNQIKQYIVACCLLVLLGSVDSSAQGTGFFNQRDDQYRLLGLKRAKENYEVARQELERQQKLFASDGVAVVLEQARRVYSEAEVNYQQSLLAVLFEEQYITFR